MKSCMKWKSLADVVCKKGFKFNLQLTQFWLVLKLFPGVKIVLLDFSIENIYHREFSFFMFLRKHFHIVFFSI